MDSLCAEVAPVRHEVFPDSTSLAAELEPFAWANELPVDSASQYAQFCVFRRARAENVLVLLDGQGADEVLGGYEQYFAAYLAGAGSGDAAVVKARYSGALDHVAPWHRNLPPFVRRTLADLTGKGSDLAFGLRRGLAQHEERLSPASLKTALRRDSLDGFLGTLLRYGDRNSMAHSVEVRLPFTDHRLFEFVQGLDERLLMGDAQTKRLLREAMRGILPEKVRTRWRKQGFVPPQSSWLRGGLAEPLEAALASPSLSSLWRRSWWLRAMARFRAGDDSLAAGLWKVLATEAWRTGFVGRIGSMPRTPPLVR
jgi:asparagine synthase (glutamine-hydrolysing)